MDKVRSFIMTNKSAFILLSGVTIGGLIGFVFKEDAVVLEPFGTLFMNMIQAIIVPLIFLTITASLGHIKSSERVGKLLGTMLIVFLITSVIAASVGCVASKFMIVNPEDTKAMVASLDDIEVVESEELNFLDKTVNLVSTDDFANLLSKNNIVALIVISLLTGIAIQKTKPKSDKFLEVLDSATVVVEKCIQFIMYYAPFGLGCYFAAFVGRFGAGISAGYIRAFIISLAACAFVYFAVYSIYAFIGGGIVGLKCYWKHIIVPSLTALSTTSSAACMPVNIKAALDIGVPKEIANTTISLGTNFHKEGTIINGAIQVAFIACLFGKSISFLEVMSLTLLGSLMVVAVPLGATVTVSIFQLTVLGCPLSAYPLLLVFGQLVDVQDTILNVAGNNVSAMLVSRFVDGKNWNKNEKKTGES